VIPTKSRRLEQKAEGLGIKGYDHGLDPLRIDLALARGDLARASKLIEHLDPESFPDHWVRVSLVNGLVALGEFERLESEAAGWVIPGTYLEPFVLRSLGVARGDRDLIDQAVARFDAMGLDWHAAQTRQMSAEPPGPRPVR
jgi:hypothetical protein